MFAVPCPPYSTVLDEGRTMTALGPSVRASGGSPPLGPTAPIGWHARGAGSSPPNLGTRDPPGRARARRVYHPDYLSPQRCTMVANDAPHWFPDHREGERRLLPSRRSGLDRRYQSMPRTVERRGAGERRVRADRRTRTERRQHLTAE